MVLVINAVRDNTRIGVVVEVHKASVKVRFANGRANVFVKASIILLVRPPKASQQGALTNNKADD